MNKIKSGGGITSNKLKNVKLNLGSPNRIVNPAGASQIGAMMGNHADTVGRTGGNPATPLHGGPAYNPPPRMGNEVAQSTVAGVGGSRTVMRSGSQGTHGPVAPGSSPGRRDILSEFGPDQLGKGRSRR
jgi:hypothetical protein